MLRIVCNFCHSLVIYLILPPPSQTTLTSTRPRITPAPIVPTPAMKNGIDTCNVVFHHSSSISGRSPYVSFSSPSSPIPPSPLAPSPPPPPPSGSPPRRPPSAEEATEVVMIELSDPVVDVGSTANLSLSLSGKLKRERESE